MTTAFQTGPGFYAANTQKTDPTIPRGCIRVFCARLEAYDLPARSDTDLNTVFTILPALAEKDRRLARALLELGRCIRQNETALRAML